VGVYREYYVMLYVKRFQVERQNRGWLEGLTSTKCDGVSRVGRRGGRLG